MKKTKTKHIIYLIPMIIIFIVVGIIYYKHYTNTIEIIKSGYNAKIKLIE